MRLLGGTAMHALTTGVRPAKRSENTCAVNTEELARLSRYATARESRATLCDT